MASLELRGRKYRLVFRFGGRKFQHPLRTMERTEAESCLARLEENLRLLERGRLVLHPGADLPIFLLSDGKLTAPPTAPEQFRLQDLHDRYLEAHGNGSMEANSLDTAAMHLRHVIASLGKGFYLQSLTFAHLQVHVDRRSKSNGFHGRPISPVTLRKEIASFRAAWNWAAQAGYVTGTFPSRGLLYPKLSEKPPFRTWGEIQRQVTMGGATPAEQRDLWDSLFLTLPEVAEILTYVKGRAAHGWIYPTCCLAAHTGARRSEMLRARVHDLDFEGRTVLLHEKKRARGRRTSRRVPMSPFLAGVLKDWLAVHPGGPYLFCSAGEVTRSKKRSRTTGHLSGVSRPSSLNGRLAGVSDREPRPVEQITRDEANDHFKRTLAGSKWQVLRGWHVFRHSFASNCAAKGVDQRVIDSWMGHTTEEMRRRYRHLLPDQQRHAIGLVFGGQ